MPSELDDRRTPLVVVGDPQSRRMPSLSEAASRCGFEMSVVSYDELPTGRSFVERLNRGDREVVVRIESPGESRETARRILAAGIEPMEQRRRVPLRQQAIDDEPLGRGEIVHPLQWFLGFEQVLKQIDFEWGARGVRWMNSPASIVTAFDKAACRELWSQTGVPIAPAPTSAPTSVPIATYSQLRAAVPDRHARIFIKLRYGYSAMGAVALEWRGDLVRAITTVEVTWNEGRPRLFLSKRPRVLQREFEIAWLIDTLAMEEIVVEDWLPKARWQGNPFDLRIVTIGGRARHVVGRANSSPFTNLNLDADRIAHEDLERHLGVGWSEALSLAERAAEQINGAWSLGMDVLMKPCRKRGVVLEANAFGDYLPGLLCDGETTYETELREFVGPRERSQSRQRLGSDATTHPRSGGLGHAALKAAE